MLFSRFPSVDIYVHIDNDFIILNRYSIPFDFLLLLYKNRNCELLYELIRIELIGALSARNGISNRTPEESHKTQVSSISLTKFMFVSYFSCKKKKTTSTFAGNKGRYSYLKLVVKIDLGGKKCWKLLKRRNDRIYL